MIVLLALLLAFLAQNLLTPSAEEFAAICVGLAAIGWAIGAQKGGLAVGVRDLALVLVVLVLAWQLLPAALTALVVFMMAGVLFAQGVDGIDIDTTPPPPPPSARGRQPSISAQYAEVDAGWGRLTRTIWTHWLSIALFVLIVAASAVLCIYDNEHIQPGLHGDEAESGIEARNLNSGRYNTLLGVGWYDQPLLSFLVQAVGLRLFGNTVSGLRTTSAVVSLLTLPLVFLLARKLFGTRAAFLTLALMAFAHWFIAYAHIGINYNQTTLLEVLAVLAFWHGWQTKQRRWFVVSGVVTGLGLYVYFASRVVPILLLTFAGILWLWQRRSAIAGLASRCAQPALRGQSVAIWASAMILVFAPMGVFFLNHAKEFGSRADFVFLFSDTQLYSRDQKLLLYTGTTDIPAALSVQVYRYGVLFNVGGDRSGQYGNQLPLLEYLSGALCVLGLALALRHARQPRFMLLLVWIVLTVIIGGVLTIESPFSPRLIGLMPVPFMLAAVALDRSWAALEGQAHESGTRRFILRAAVVLLLAASVYNNYWSFFDHYLNSIEGWAQREPATAVANYAAHLGPDQTLYMLSAPELYIWHGTIRFIAPNLRGFDMLNPEDELPVRDPNTGWAAFVMLPNHTQWIDKLRTLYPHGTLREWRRATGELWFDIYEAPTDDVSARR